MKHFDTCIGYAMMRLATAFPHAMPAEQAEETRKTRFLSGLRPNLKSALAWEMCLDGGGRQMTYEEMKDAARRVEQREDPTTSDDPFVRENATLPHEMTDNGIGADNLIAIRLVPSTGVIRG